MSWKRNAIAVTLALGTSHWAAAQNVLRPEEPNRVDTYVRPATVEQLEESPNSSRDGRALLHEAMTLSQTAASVDELSTTIELCTSALKHKLSAEEAKYARELASWSHNKRGEVYSSQASEFFGQAQEKEAARLDRQALDDFNSAIKLDARRWKALHNRGISYGILGLHDDAVSDFTAVIKLKPGHQNAWFNRGEIHRDDERYELAIKDYAQAIKLKPDDAAAYRCRGLALAALNRRDLASSDFDKALELDPENATNLVESAKNLLELGEWEGAFNDFNAAIKVDAECAEAYRGAAWVMAVCPLKELRNAPQAAAHAKRAMQLAEAAGGADYSYYDTSAAALAANGKFEDAKKIVTVGLKMAPAGKEAPLQQRLAVYSKGKAFAYAPKSPVQPASAQMPRTKR